MSVSVTLPVLVTSISYVITSPAPPGPVVLGVFTTPTNGTSSPTLTAALPFMSVTSGPLGGVPVTVTVLLISVFRSTSAWVTVQLPVRITDSPGASVPEVTGQEEPPFRAVTGPPRSGSSTSMSVSVTLPVLVTSISYVITAPAPTGSVVLGVLTTPIDGFIGVTVTVEVLFDPSGSSSSAETVAVLS